MRRTFIAIAALLTLIACTPDLETLVAWVAAREADAVAEGRPCPELADELAWRGLPQHFHWVIDRESDCNPEAVNRRSGALGLTQVMPSWLRTLCPLGVACTREDLLTVEANLDAAAVIYDVQGPAAWSQTW